MWALLSMPSVQFPMEQHFVWLTKCCSGSECSMCMFVYVARDTGYIPSSAVVVRIE